MRGKPRNRYNTVVNQDRPKSPLMDSPEDSSLAYEEEEQEKNRARRHSAFWLDYHLQFFLQGRVTVVTFILGMSFLSFFLLMSTPLATRAIDRIFSIDSDSFMKTSLSRGDFFASERHFFGLMKTSSPSSELQVWFSGVRGLGRNPAEPILMNSFGQSTESEYDLSKVIPPLPRGGRQLTATQSYLQPLSSSAIYILMGAVPLHSKDHHGMS